MYFVHFGDIFSNYGHAAPAYGGQIATLLLYQTWKQD